MKEMKREIKEVREMQMYRPPIPAMFPSAPYQLLNQQSQLVPTNPNQPPVQHRPPQMPFLQTAPIAPPQHQQPTPAMPPQQTNPAMAMNAVQNTTQNTL